MSEKHEQRAREFCRVWGWNRGESDLAALLAEVAREEYARGQREMRDACEREFDVWVSWIPKAGTMERAESIGLKGYIPTGGRPEDFKIRLRAILAPARSKRERREK